MKELSLHILDITQNSIRAKAKLVKLTIFESRDNNELTIIIEDDGCGIPADMLLTITDPFVTTRTTRKVGLGLSLFKAAAEACNGYFEITSTPGVGTKVVGSFERDHIDRVPLGNMADTILTMVMSFGATDLIYEHTIDKQQFIFDTREIKETLEVESLNEPDILNWIRGFVKEGLEEIMEEDIYGKVIS
ncbi:ATP-binding protein [Acetobacterium woodii]|uniref:histidine kinase n=1 Tax=Acetobacterium woodii (strain ATCC 29683 / DSM 1030 / JCM 2381 / KCTC 1655 / WB1) TaxID=931626 RepID=H6LFG6_ACEWD|nr:ATP-binding protein [Acetobacterium woodii]AFA49453.1 sensory transduction histidine kinase HydE [Acetobacterium woodii DSM 1030]